MNNINIFSTNSCFLLLFFGGDNGDGDGGHFNYIYNRCVCMCLYCDKSLTRTHINSAYHKKKANKQKHKLKQITIIAN